MKEELDVLSEVESRTASEQAPDVPEVTVDQEVWVKNQVMAAIRMARRVESSRRVGADNPALACAIDGIANGAAVEIVHILGKKNIYTNLQEPPVMETLF